MTQDEIISRLQGVTFRVTGQRVAPTDSLIKEGRVNSIKFVDLLLAVEDEFKIFIDLGEIPPDSMDTLQSMASMVGGRLSGGK